MEDHQYLKIGGQSTKTENDLDTHVKHKYFELGKNSILCRKTGVSFKCVDNCNTVLRTYKSFLEHLVTKHNQNDTVIINLAIASYF